MLCRGRLAKVEGLGRPVALARWLLKAQSVDTEISVNSNFPPILIDNRQKCALFAQEWGVGN